MLKSIQIRGARVHNLKSIDLDLPRNKLIVITGVSGSGKSSLAFDTLYAEGQRRYVESLSSYARQFLERMDRPDVDEIRGISPAVAIEQKNPTRTSRSTVATATEIHDYLRLLFARIGETFCPDCGVKVKKDHVQDAVDTLLKLPKGTPIQITFPLQSMDDGLTLLIDDLKYRGFHRFLRDGKTVTSEELRESKIASGAGLSVIVDRLKIGVKERERLADSLDLTFREGGGVAEVLVSNVSRFEDSKSPEGNGDTVLRFSDAFECSGCSRKFIEPQPRLFSFNNPFGACPTCRGFGEVIELDLGLVIPDESKSLEQGAIAPWKTDRRRGMRVKLADAAAKHGIDMKKPWRELPEAHQKIVVEGEGRFPGVRGFFKKMERKKYKIGVRVMLSRYRGFVACPDCNMGRLRPEANFIRVANKNITELTRMPIQQTQTFFEDLNLSEFDAAVVHQVLQELRSRVSYLVDVGLGYLTLDRRTQTLSGGEYQRINLATSVGFKLVGSLYVLDEPSIGLHPRDNDRLIKILFALRDLGNTVVVVEHDREMMLVSDDLIDLGPAAGENGGELVYQGSTADLLSNGTHTLTAAYLKGERVVAPPKARRKPSAMAVTVENATENNLKGVDVQIPLGLMTVVTGVSGSGKSTLVHDVLYAAAAKHFGVWQKRVGRHHRIGGLSQIDGVVLVDQAPIGRTPRSNPVTYTKAFDGIRRAFAETRSARARGFTPGTFSFNTAGGRCDRCEGAGAEKVEMQFLADLYLKCEVCDGKRYKREVLEIKYRGKSIFDVLNMPVTEALSYFADESRITRKLKILDEVGLGYIKLGQPATTLSGGEAQRVKLAAYLDQKRDKHYLYLFDEPTSGLHFHDISKLLLCLNKLIENGNSVLVIEHNLDVIKCADYIIDLGPEGGHAGGYLVTSGTPEEVAACDRSYTGQYLKAILK